MSKFATLRTTDGTRAVELDGDTLVDLGCTDVGAYLAGADVDSAAGTRYPVAGADFAQVVLNPSKIICVGLNYRSHIEEMGRDLPDHPVLFAKFPDSLTGPNDEVTKPAETEKFDWECELTVVVGHTVRHADEDQAAAAIAGFTGANDYSVRDWQFRTREWLQGKMWDSTTPVGPYVVTPDELPGGVRPTVGTQLTIDGVEKQHAHTSDLLFDPVELVRYVSTIITLRPGDLILTGTNGGVGHARKPPEFLDGGETVQITIEGIGSLTNRIVRG